ncbi:hypothetical protein U1Q18_016073 [Sarracenia purpurea var. burkii]
MARGRPDYLPSQRQGSREAAEGRRVCRHLSSSEDNRSLVHRAQSGSRKVSQGLSLKKEMKRKGR